MTRTKGLFIVIEGTDGSGKGAQTEILLKKLKDAGQDVATFDFPQHDQPSSYFISQYLNGKYGSANDVGPYTGSLFFALDRYEAKLAINQALDEGKVVLANRFVGSNMAHQGTKFKNAEERRGYFIWLDNLEFEMLGIPRPDMNLVLRVPAEIAQENVDLKSKRTYTDLKRDIHEADLTHMQRSVEVYDDLCKLFPKDFSRIDCVRDSKLLSIDEISNLLWEKVRPMLPVPIIRRDNTPAEIAKAFQPPLASNPYITKDEGSVTISATGYNFLEDAVTNSTEDVYGFYDKLSTNTIAAAMARLSRRGDDMRQIILDEFSVASDKDSELLKRVITAYGDDSVQQLVGQYIVVENASNILTKKLEWGRLAAYLEQSTRYIYFDKPDQNGKYRFHVPSYFDPKIKKIYTDSLTEIFQVYSKLVRTLTNFIQTKSVTPEDERDGPWRSATKAQACDAVRNLLPVATESTVGIFASGQALESLIMHLLSDELPEARETGEKLLKEARKTIPTFLERADKPERGGAIVAYRANTRATVKKLADEYLPNSFAGLSEPVTLTHVWPRNELDLIADMLYEYSDQPLEVIKKITDSWSYDKKSEILKAYMGERLNRRHRPGRALEKAHYSWDIMCDYGIFRDLQRHRMVDDLEWQILTPRFGYEIPKVVEEAGLSDEYEHCFELSLELYGQLLKAGYEIEAQYATLMGHRMRWKVTYNAREAFHLHELRTSPQGHPGYRKLVLQMHQKLAEVHPLLAEAMIFVNQDEDPELTRLAAERATQYKLDKLN